MLKLHHYWSSVCAQKVRMVLAEKSLDWESSHVDLFDFEQWQPWYLKLNNKGVVPTLDHDGQIITESNIICEYLEEVFPEVRLTPDDPVDRARLRKWMLISEEDLHSAIAVASFNIRHRARMLAKYSIDELTEKLKDTPLSELARITIQRLADGMPQEAEDDAFRTIEKVLDWLEEGLGAKGAGPWLLGDNHSLADIAFAPYLNRIEVLDQPELITAAKRPHIAEWWANLQQLPSFQDMMSFKNPDQSDPVPR